MREGKGSRSGCLFTVCPMTDSLPTAERRGNVDRGPSIIVSTCALAVLPIVLFVTQQARLPTRVWTHSNWMDDGRKRAVS